MARPKGIPAHNRRNLIGQSFGRLTVVAQAPSRPHCGTTFGYWLCTCECGVVLEVMTGNLTKGNTKSCGCLNRDRRLGNSRAKVHGHNNRNSPTYISWTAMKKRCRDKTHPHYGAAGISYDPRWEDFASFLADMGERPAGTTLDRIDGTKNYDANNCRWATIGVQLSNRRVSKFVTYEGRTQTIGCWAKEFGIPNGVLYNRIIYLGWPLERALHEQPIKRRRRS
jgi:hypothetical protein